MSRARVVKMKQEIQVGTDPTQMLTLIRNECTVSNGKEVGEWVKSLPDVKDAEGNNAVQFFQFEVSQLPPALKSMIDFLLEQRNIDYKDIRRFDIHVIKPVAEFQKRQMGKKGKPVHVNTFENLKITSSDRFLYISGLEKITYKIIDISAMAQQFGVGGAQRIVEEFTEQTGAYKAFHMDIQAAIAMSINYDDADTFHVPERKGWRSTYMKKGKGRWGIVIDVVATVERLDEVVEQKMKPIEDLLQNNPDSKKAKQIRSFQEKIKKEQEALVKDDSDEDVEDVEIPDLVAVDESGKPNTEVRDIETAEVKQEEIDELAIDAGVIDNL